MADLLDFLPDFLHDARVLADINRVISMADQIFQQQLLWDFRFPGDTKRSECM